MIILLIISILFGSIFGISSAEPAKVSADELTREITRDTYEAIYYEPLGLNLYPTAATGLTEYKWEYFSGADDYIVNFPDADTYYLNLFSDTILSLTANSLFCQTVSSGGSSSVIYVFSPINISINLGDLYVNKFGYNQNYFVTDAGTIYLKSINTTDTNRYIQFNSDGFYIGGTEYFSMAIRDFFQTDTYAYGHTNGISTYDEDETGIMPAGFYHLEKELYNLSNWSAYDSDTVTPSEFFRVNSGGSWTYYDIIAKVNDKITYINSDNNALAYSITNYINYDKNNVDTIIWFDNYYVGGRYFNVEAWGAVDDIVNDYITPYCACYFYTPPSEPTPQPSGGQGFFGTIWGWIKTAASWVNNNIIQPVFNFVGNLIKWTFNAAEDVYQWFGRLANNVGAAIENITKKLPEIFGDVADTVVSVVEKVPDVVDSVLDTAKNAFSSFSQIFKSPITWIVIAAIVGIIVFIIIDQGRRRRK